MREGRGTEEEEEEEDLFVFNDTIEGPRAPAVKPGRVTQEGRRHRVQWAYSTVQTVL
jgi:hypothetical protein